MTAKHPIPEAALKKHIAILGMNGSGKTSVAKSQIMEPALKLGERVCNIDPTGVGWGMRLKADGVAKGFDIYIVGGEHADFPLFARDGKAWGEIVGTSSDSFVFDTSQLTVEDRSSWFTAFAETLLRKNKGALNFVLDEAHLFAPQGGSKSGGIAPRMLHATNNLLALGRSRGLRITMISQRPAKLHKDSLTQAHTLVAMMMTSPQDRGAVKDWIADQADPETGKEIIASLPTLDPGEGWVWAPRERVLARVKFGRPKTFDSSSAPEGDAEDGPKLSAINPAAVTAMLEKVAKETVASDPAKLKAEIARLNAELKKAPNGPAETKTVYLPITDGEIEAYRQQGRDLAIAENAGIWFRHGIEVAVAEFARRAEFNIAAFVDKEYREWQKTGAIPKAVAPKRLPPVKSESVPPAATQTSAGTPRRSDKPAPVAGGAGSLPGPEQKIVDAIRWWNVFGIDEPTHAQVGFIAKYSHKSSTWDRYLSSLRSAGIIEPKGPLKLTEAGVREARDPSEVPSAERLRENVLERIDGPQAKILRPIFAAYPDGLTHEAAAEAAGYSPGSSTWDRYLSGLRSLDLIERKGELRAQAWTFPE